MVNLGLALGIPATIIGVIGVIIILASAIVSLIGLTIIGATVGTAAIGAGIIGFIFAAMFIIVIAPGLLPGFGLIISLIVSIILITIAAILAYRCNKHKHGMKKWLKIIGAIVIAPLYIPYNVTRQLLSDNYCI